ncbi:DUF397 domain-containing protein [Nocardia suismassiliense]|uniref:DUF397 domain-containing protein n=1 Tax=Nocardia suismassiliense TaxID=2077092 RepID=UPI000D1EB931|nr:DUF397 domain-containing protein [Nocardia suismassiliense]
MTDDPGIPNDWRTSSKSNGQGNCVEVGFLDNGNVVVRDTKDLGIGPTLTFTPAEWDAFLDGALQGEFNRP